MKYRKLWLGFAAVLIGSFAVLGYYGSEIYRQAPPIPEQVVTESSRPDRYPVPTVRPANRNISA
ncbi:hypothetical protein GCM10027347_57370 [Larkinella harenae]